MSTNIFNIGKVNAINNNDITIHTSSANAAELVRSFMQGRAEDIQAEEVKAEPTVAKNATTASNSLPFFIPEKLEELGTYSISEYEEQYHIAVKAGAPKLAKFIKHYKELEVLDTKDYNKKETYEILKAYFGKEMDFGYPNFAAYY